MEFFTKFIIIAAVTLILNYIISLAKKKAELTTDGTMLLKYPGVMPLIGYISMGFGALIGIITIFQIIPTTNNEIVPYLVLFFLLIGIPMILFEKRRRIIVTDYTISVTEISGNQKVISWNEIQNVRLNVISQLVIQASDKQIKINTLMTGFESFLDMMKNKLDSSLYEKAVEDYNKAYNNPQKK